MKKINIFDVWYDEEYPPEYNKKIIINIKEKIENIISKNLYEIDIEDIKNKIDIYLSNIEEIKNYKVYVTGIFSFDIYIEFKNDDILLNCQIKDRLS